MYMYDIFGSDSELSDFEQDLRVRKKVKKTVDLLSSLDNPSNQEITFPDSRAKSLKNNHDNCSACLGEGRLLCCLTCPRAFHFSCLEEGFNDSNIPDDQWKCSECCKRDVEYKGIFAPLLEQLDSTNPKIFQLPASIRDLKDVFAHPETGDYTEYKNVDISIVDNLTDHEDQENRLDYCSHCLKSSFQFTENTALMSSLIPKRGTLQAQRSEMIKCDYCNCYWHLDCLDPPLSCKPPQFCLSEYPVLDLKQIQKTKQMVWGDETPGGDKFENFDGSFIDINYMKNLYRATPNSSICKKYIRIRPKWMCSRHKQNRGLKLA